MAKDKYDFKIGDVVTILWNDAPDMEWDGVPLPVYITAVYPRFYVGKVLPHRNPNGFDISKPYPITLDRIGLQVGDRSMKVKEVSAF